MLRTVLTHLGYIALFILVLIVSWLLYLGGDAAAGAVGVIPEVAQGAVAGAVVGLCIGIYKVIARRLAEVEPFAYGGKVERVPRVEWAVTLGGVGLIAGVFPLLFALHFVAKKDPEAYLEEGRNAGRARGDYDQALVYLSKAIELNPKYVPAYRERASVYTWKAKGTGILIPGRPIPRETRENYDKAIQDYTTVIRLDPKSADAYYWRGDAHSGKGDWKKAVEDYKTALKIAPKDKWIVEHANMSLRNAEEQLAKRSGTARTIPGEGPNVVIKPPEEKAAVPPPVVSGVSPNPVPWQEGSQTLTLRGSGFAPEAKVTLRWRDQAFAIPADHTTVVSATEIQVRANVSRQAAEWVAEWMAQLEKYPTLWGVEMARRREKGQAEEWTAEVTNPDERVSNRWPFTVTVAPTGGAPPPRRRRQSP